MFEWFAFSLDDIIAFFAWLSGAFFAFCLIPQLQVMWENRSATDVSIHWTILLIIGLLLQILYLFLMGGYIWLTVIPEFLLVVSILWSKWYLDRLNAEGYIPVNGSDNGSHDHGFRISFNYNGITKDALREFPAWITKKLEEEIAAHHFHLIHKHSSSSRGASAPGFSIFCLLSIGHVAAHLFTDSGTLTLDIMTREQSIETEKFSNELHQAIIQHLPNCDASINSVFTPSSFQHA
jgi:S-adenosylmethionine/arginine decarboxylase-like enzyme/uncharacterized protein with PQ loop repeat